MTLAWEQTQIFLWAIVAGAGIMAVYDLFRMLRVAFAQGEWLIFLEDVSFFAAAGMITWFYLLESCDGRLRGFVFVGEVIGALLYFLTLGRLVIAVARTVIAFMEGVIRKLIIQPLGAIVKLLVRLGRWLRGLLWRILKRLGAQRLLEIWKNRKKNIQMRKLHLPAGGRLLYNHFVTGIFARKAEMPSNQEREVENGAQDIFPPDP